jgi:hypothetical protein
MFTIGFQLAKKQGARGLNKKVSDDVHYLSQNPSTYIEVFVIP